MPIFEKNFVLYLLFLTTLYTINCFINPNFVERRSIPITLIENTQHVESWDDGEIPWDVSWDDGEIPWDVVENKKEIKHIPEKNMDTSKMWEYLYYNDEASLFKMLQDENLSRKEKNYYWLFLAMLVNMNNE